MSAESTLAFYGVRFEIADEEITSVEERTHPLIVQARQNRLKTYWGRFGPKGDKYFLFVGDKLGILGFENLSEVSLSFDELANRVSETDARLRQAGVVERPMFYLSWEPDI